VCRIYDVQILRIGCAVEQVLAYIANNINGSALSQNAFVRSPAVAVLWGGGGGGVAFAVVESVGGHGS
jgi:hypothetical protein